MFLFSLMLGCVPEQNNDGFGIVNTSSDRTLDTSEEVAGELDTSTKNPQTMICWRIRSL